MNTESYIKYFKKKSLNAFISGFLKGFLFVFVLVTIYSLVFGNMALSSFSITMIFGDLSTWLVAIIVGLAVGFFGIVLYEHYKSRVKRGDKILILHGEIEQIEKVKGGKLFTFKIDTGKGCILQGLLDTKGFKVGDEVNIYIFTKDAPYPIPKAYRTMKLSEADKYRFKESWIELNKDNRKG